MITKITPEVGITTSRLYVPFSDYKKQIAELEAENKRLRAALEMLHDSYLTPDDDGDYYPILINHLAQVQDALAITARR